MIKEDHKDKTKQKIFLGSLLFFRGKKQKILLRLAVVLLRLFIPQKGDGKTT